jgi:hypothetical protein
MVEHKSHILRHNVLISQTIDDDGSFKQKLSCPFAPDEFKVRGIGFTTPDVVTDLFSLHVEGLGAGGPFGTPIGSFMSPSMAFNGIIVPLGTFASGSLYRFRILVAGEPTIEANAGTLNVHLEFRKYVS